MSSELRAVALIAVALALGACGFEPLYGSRAAAPVERELARVSVDPITDRTGQLLRNALYNRLDPNNLGLQARYRLVVELSESTSRVAVRRDASATRASLTITARFVLVGSEGGKEVTKGSVSSVNSYDILSTENEPSTLAAEQQARQRAAYDLANEIAVRIGLVLDRLPPQSG